MQMNGQKRTRPYGSPPYFPNNNKRQHFDNNDNPAAADESLAQTLASLTTALDTAQRMFGNPDTPENLLQLAGALMASLQATILIITQQQQQLQIPTAAEQERARSLVIVGVPEPNPELPPTARALADRQQVNQLLDQLEVEVIPVSSYRMGRHSANPAKKGGGRLTKLVLPATTFQWRIRGQWKRNKEQIRKNLGWPHLNIRCSLSPEELAEQRNHHRFRAPAEDRNPNTIMVSAHQLADIAAEMEQNSATGTSNQPGTPSRGGIRSLFSKSKN